MPSLSQLLGVKKGSNSSPPSRQGFFPFSRKWPTASSRGRQHLRSKSDNTVVCHHGGDSARSTDGWKRSPPVSGYSRDGRESYETRYERYRQIYLATSPERELSTLNAALLNVRKWLKKKHECLTSLQHSSRAAQQDTAAPPSDHKVQDGRDTLQDNQDTLQDTQALLERLVKEAGDQQEAVDVLLDRGRRYLAQRACITLEVDLDNLAFLWAAYTKQLHLLHGRYNDPLAELGTLSTPEGKENVHLTLTPVKWRRGPRGTAGRQLLSVTPDHHPLSPGVGESSGVPVTPVSITPDQPISPARGERPGVPETQHLSAFSPERNGALDSVPDSEHSDPPFAQSDTGQATRRTTQDRSNTAFATQKSLPPGSQPSVATDTRTPPCNTQLKRSGEKNGDHTPESSGTPAREGNCQAQGKPRRKLPPIPVSSSGTASKEPVYTKPVHKEPAGEDPVPTQPEKPSGEARHATRGRKPSSPRSERTKVIAASLWPGEGNSGWLKVAGEGIFSRSSQQRSELLPHGVSPPRSPGEPPPAQSAALAPVSQPAPVSADTCTPGERQVAEGLLGKRGKELHNGEKQGRQAEQPASQPDQPARTALVLPQGLTASEENLKMEMEEALREIRGSDSLMDLSDDTTAMDSNRNNASPTRDVGDALLLDDLDLPTGPKRRRMNLDTPSSLSSCSGSPLISGDNSAVVTPSDSPAGTLRRDYKQRYKKDELWKAIESNYKYLMDKEIIETCQSTETALVGETEEVNPNVSFTEFLQQYQELIDWLNQAQRHTQRHLNSLSEKYLNQTYHEEMLEKSPHRESLTKYAHQLLLQQPSLRDQVTLRLQRLNAQWSAVEAAITPPAGQASTQSMLHDLECDLTALRRWLNATESRLLPLTIRADWTDAELQERLKQHQALQQDIESHSRIVSAVLKLSERLEQERQAGSKPGPGERGQHTDHGHHSHHSHQGHPSHHSHHSHQGHPPRPGEGDSVQLVALGLERRWHGIWLQSLEWQCRLEEAIHRRKGLYGSGFNFSSFNLPTLDESCGSDLDLKVSGNITSGSNGSLLELSDDSLLFIGTRSERFLEDSPSPTLNPPTLPSPKLTNFLDRSSGDSANISECESKMGDSPRGVLLSQGRTDLTLSEGEAEVRVGMTKGAHEARDVGYSSESQSNDETESMQQQIALECRYAGIIEVSSDSPLGEKMAIPPPGGVRQDYYCMTHVDLDSTDKTTTDDGNTTDDRENVVRAAVGVKGGAVVDVERLGQGDGAGSVGKTALPGETQTGVEVSNAARGGGEDIEVKSWLESSDEFDKVERARQAQEGKAGVPEQPLSASSLLVGSESDSATESQEKIRYLIDHAEDLVKTSPRPTAPASPKRRTSPSKQTQTVTTGTSSVESSCDASSENSDDSAGEEFSTATDDAEETLFDSVINLDSTADLTSREDVATMVTSCVSLDSARLRKQTGPRGSKKDRPWSVVGFQDLKKIDFQPLSTSESAIDRVHPHTDTDSSSSHFTSVSHASTFPRRTRNKVYQRAVSACEQSSPRATKRKLKYSSSSSATDSQASRSSATRVAASTEDDEDDHTLVYDSVEQLRCQGRPPCLLETESETTDEYVTASMDEVMTSADEDPHNSTGSFSENAWDNYQMMYPTASEDATEEVLHWEPVDDMEFDDDFTFTVPKSSSLLQDAISRTANKLKLKNMGSGGGCEDSDSDMEDFHSVLEDSETCLKVVDRSLKKKRSNPMGTGLASHGKYAEILATCETYIHCMKDVCSHLTQEDIGINDVQRVQDLLYQWEKLHALAADRHQQSQQLSGVADSMGAMRAVLSEAKQCLSFELFASKEELGSTITALRVKGDQLEKQGQVIREHQQVVEVFVQHHPSINVTKFVEELTALDTDTTSTQQKVSSHLQALENNWAVWCQYLEGQQELDALMAADRERLYALLCQREAGHKVTKRDVLKELETLQSNLCVYEDKLHVLQAMRQRLMRVSDDSTQRAFLASLADLRNQLQVVSQRCRQMYRDVEDQDSAPEMDQSELGRLAVSAATVQESSQAKRNMSQLSRYDIQSAVEEGGMYRTVPRGRAWSWLRSVPVQIVALIMVAGLVYVLDPDILSDLASFSLTFTPELRHVNGPPPL